MARPLVEVGPLKARVRKMDVLATKLDKDPAIRQAIIQRLVKAAGRIEVPIAVLHQMAQAIEMYGDDKED